MILKLDEQDFHDFFECDCERCGAAHDAFTIGTITATVSAIRTLSAAMSIANRDKIGTGARRDLANYAVAANRLLQSELEDPDFADRINAPAQYVDAETALT